MKYAPRVSPLTSVRRRRARLAAAALLLAAGAFAAAPAAPTESDEYTRYELLAPGTAQFHILYEVTASARGARDFFNPIRKGSEASGERVFDVMTGKPLEFKVVTGEEAKKAGLSDAEADVDYIRITLPRAVPADGGVRLLIEKTYRDPKSYFQDGEKIVFSRSLGIWRDAVVFPPGYEIVGCNVPAQFFREADGRMRVSFMNTAPDPVNVVVKARRLPE